jgi:hypothetical protein
MDIREAVEQRKKQIERLQREIQTLEAAEELMKGKPREKPQSQPDMAGAILEEIGKPMHVTQIAAQVKSKFGQIVKPNNLGVMLFRYAKRGSRFYKVEGKPNTYGLVKWQEIKDRIENNKASHTTVHVTN